jgi:hypothetical protein
MRKVSKRVLRLGLLAAVGYAIWRALAQKRPATGVNWEPQPFPYPPQPALPAEPVATAEPWVDAEADGSCPVSHPVKAKLSSGIFHAPGGANYERTRADRCYASGDAATADGLRPAKR